MKILAFESSCDETAVAVVEDGRTVLSDAIASQADLHALYGGVVPEIASRKHVEAIAGLTDQALREAGCEKSDIDAVAVTYAPGLIGAVLVGLSFAKSVAFALGVPLIPVHHIRGHIAANYLAFPDLEPPFLALAISGGNTLIVDVRDYTDMVILGATRDDAAGECFDKAARVLGLPYPGGKPIDQLAQQSAGGVYQLPHAQGGGAPIRWGVLTLLGTAALLTIPLDGLLRRIPPRAGLAGSFLLFLLTRDVNRGYLGFEGGVILPLPQSWYQNTWTALLGFPGPDFSSADYFSLLPWLVLFWTGYFLYTLRPEEPRREPRLPLVTALGRRSLLVYMLHQPVIYGVLWALFALAGG